jgi:hypothetical protein
MFSANSRYIKQTIYTATTSDGRQVPAVTLPLPPSNVARARVKNPQSRERLAIWRKALPATTPDGAPLLEDINWSLLAGQITLTGADIKSAALGAAFLARGEDSRIGMRHVLAAVQREMAKRGQVLRLRPAEATGA